MRKKHFIKELEKDFKSWGKEKTEVPVPQVPTITKRSKSLVVVAFLIAIVGGLSLGLGVKRGVDYVNNEMPMVKAASSPYDITWIITDEFAPDPRYTVTVNGTPKAGHENEVWASEFPIVVDVRGHQIGEYNYTIVATDGYGGCAEDMVLVNVTGPVAGILSVNSPSDITYNYDNRWGQSVYKLNNTLNLTFGGDTTSHSFEDIGGSGGVIEFVFKPLESIDIASLIFEFAPASSLRIGSSGGELLNIICSDNPSSGSHQIITDQTYRVRIEFDYLLDTTKWFVDNILDGTSPYSPPSTIDCWFAGYDSSYLSMILYEFNVWKVA
jgi:hypothetical protein